MEGTIIQVSETCYHLAHVAAAVIRSEIAALDRAAVAWKGVWEVPDFANVSPAFRLAALSNGAGVFLRRHWAKGKAEDLSIVVAQ